METLAYIHLSEAHDNPETAAITYDWKGFAGFNGKLPGKASIRFLSVTVALLIVGMSSSAFALTLQRGNSGSQVSNLQRNLTIAGYYDGPITGYYGSLTQSAVSRFQRENGLRADGVAGPQTLANLEGRGGSVDEPIVGGGFSNTALRRGSNGTAVTRLQNTLRSLGFYNGPITGYYGRLTQDSVIKFQKARGLVADGIVGPRTKAALTAD